ncbi:hypothetical protein IQ229_17615, partial [Nostoc cf. edaphicum LEGE 07299]|nr:hypothetical protein [Nostoc cf. edaphicum LEGE 07299]
FTQGLREYLKTGKTQYAEGVRSSKALGDAEEAALKEALTEYKKTFKAAA